ncbi:at-hook motif nuclear-localized protein 1 [Quercus suber]|uniref:AT-hook motif nuclear-localized protein n=1 Tax=Quercus suber TaxID=58331 RepID=A0AAW0LS29_QUESU
MEVLDVFVGGNDVVVFNGGGVRRRREVEEAEAEAELGGGDDGAVVVGDTEPEELTGLELVAENKNNTRGPPRKYDVMVVGTWWWAQFYCHLALHLKAQPNAAEEGLVVLVNSSSSLLSNFHEGGSAADTAGTNFTPHVVNVQTNEDIVSKIASFSQRGPRSVCILSATGCVSRVTISQPGNSGGILRYEACPPTLLILFVFPVSILSITAFVGWLFLLDLYYS